jgi:hypothetical protein
VARAQAVNRLHRLLLELFAGGAKKFLSAAQAKELLAAIGPRDIAGQTRRRLAAGLITELTQAGKRIKTAGAELKALAAATGSSLLQRHGIGPSSAARLPGDVADIARFADKGRFASWNGTAPLEASSGDQVRRRLSRAGNRPINRVLPIMAIVALRNDTEGRACYRRKLATGKTTMEAMRCLKRRLPDIACQQIRADAKRLATGPGGHAGATLQLTQSPRSALRSSHFPDPPVTSLEPSSSPRLDTEGSHERAIGGSQRHMLDGLFRPASAQAGDYPGCRDHERHLQAAPSQVGVRQWPPVWPPASFCKIAKGHVLPGRGGRI